MLELLSPARNLECGKAAIDHGADAVYIGAERFGARAAAGNSVADIAQLCDYAHTFGAKVYVTVNTILYDNELEPTRQLLQRLDDAGVDAVLVQDMAVLSLLPQNRHFALHASTQTDNRTAEKVAWLGSLGFSRVVLARELSIEEIADIHRRVPDVELEAFVHGALCVSYSGLCYASQHCFRRSANRGECAQFCRLAFSLEDADGNIIDRDRHLLSLKDMNRLAHLQALADAGVVSFKIEGRLKDVSYVKNVTAAYNQQLTKLTQSNPKQYRRASLGHCSYTFTPNLHKTFNRGFTPFMLDGRKDGIASPDTPKAMGELIGHVKELRGASFTVAGTASFANGDGLCFFDNRRQLQGFRVNRVEGNRLFPLKMPQGLHPGTVLYRNVDTEFERQLSRPSSTRKISITERLDATAEGFRLTVSVPNGLSATAEVKADHQKAERDQRENIVRQLTKLGSTPYECHDVQLPDGFDYFIPSSVLAQLRRDAVELLSKKAPPTPRKGGLEPQGHAQMPLYKGQGHQYNIANSVAQKFYEDHGLSHTTPAYELSRPAANTLLMQCRHCLRFAYGFCPKHGGSRPRWHEPLYLTLPDARRFRLDFDCQHCQMNVYSER